MQINSTIIKLLQVLENFYQFKKNIISEKEGIGIKDLIKINSDRVLIAGRIDFEQKISNQGLTIKNQVDLSKFNKIIKNISSSIVRLNHVGISYFCRNIDKEVDQIKSQLSGSKWKIFEENSGDAKSRWFFVGDLLDWQDPLFEIVLTESKTEIYNDWTPHFQIDIDTNLSIEELIKIADKIYESNFFNWKLDIPKLGVVLAMGCLGDVSGTNFYLGIGTNLRKTEFHRKHLLKEIVSMY
jgi:hypothetical protein